MDLKSCVSNADLKPCVGDAFFVSFALGFCRRNPPKPPPDDDKPPDIAPEEFSADVDHTQERDRFRVKVKRC